MHPATPPRVAVINSNDDILVVITAALADEGYHTIAGHARLFRLGQESLKEFIAAHDPHVILWDIAPPFIVNWQYFQEVKDLPIMQGRRFILTSTNVRGLRELVGDLPEGMFEILGKPYELDEIYSAIHKALSAR